MPYFRSFKAACATLTIATCSLLAVGCTSHVANQMSEPAELAQQTATKRELLSLPEPKGPIKVAVYNFRDQTGQYKPLPNVSSFSTAVTQGTTTLLVQALKDSTWFTPLEREGLQNLLTERKIIRATLEKQGQDTSIIPALDVATLILEGGIVGYDTNLVTGGLGAKYFGLGGSTKYRMDQITVSLRAVDPRSGQILKTVSTSKTVLSRELSAGIFRFVEFKRLLEAEMGYTTNEPVQIAVRGAIEKAVTALIIEGILDDLWKPKYSIGKYHPIITSYKKDKEGSLETQPKIPDFAP